MTSISAPVVTTPAAATAAVVVVVENECKEAADVIKSPPTKTTASRVYVHVCTQTSTLHSTSSARTKVIAYTFNKGLRVLKYGACVTRHPVHMGNAKEEVEKEEEEAAQMLSLHQMEEVARERLAKFPVCVLLSKSSLAHVTSHERISKLVLRLMTTLGCERFGEANDKFFVNRKSDDFDPRQMGYTDDTIIVSADVNHNLSTRLELVPVTPAGRNAYFTWVDKELRDRVSVAEVTRISTFDQITKMEEYLQSLKIKLAEQETQVQSTRSAYEKHRAR